MVAISNQLVNIYSATETKDYEMRNADATRERILEAAMAEFSAYGVAGARVDRIAATAKCNKNLIYVYFENKEMLFATLLKKHLVRVYEELQFTPEDLPGFAARVFDFAMANPDLMRLLAWSGLEQTPESVAERRSTMDDRVAVLKKAQSAGQVGNMFPPDFLMTAVITLATAWTAANPFGLMLDAAAVKRPAALRANIVKAVTMISGARVNKA
jgi:AcrR family transcriptional regulator